MTTLMQQGDLICYEVPAAYAHYHHQSLTLCMTDAGNILAWWQTPRGVVGYTVKGYYDSKTNCWHLTGKDGREVDTCAGDSILP